MVIDGMPSTSLIASTGIELLVGTLCVSAVATPCKHIGPRNGVSHEFIGIGILLSILLVTAGSRHHLVLCCSRDAGYQKSLNDLTSFSLSNQWIG